MSLKKLFRKSVIKTNLVFSIGFGVLTGILFPFYAALFVEFKSDQLQLIFIISCIGAGIIVGLAAFSITRATLVKVIKSLAVNLRQIAKGDADLTRTISFQSADELGDIVKWFNLFVSKLGRMIGQTKKNIDISKKQSHILSEQLQQVTGALDDIIRNNKQMKEIQFRQETKLENMQNSLSILDDSIVIVISNVMEFFGQLDTLTNIVIKQSSVVDSVIENISRVSDKIGAENQNNQPGNASLYSTGHMLISSMYDLIEKSRSNTTQIEKHLQSLDNIAVNINLIAINASIEATHAGEAGRGFRVVAGEIRKLADQANQFTEGIKNILEEINENSEYTIKEINRNKREYNNILREVSTTTGNLHTAAGKIRSVTTEVKENYKIIGSLLVNLKEKIENLKQNSQYSHAAISELQEMTAEIQRQLNSLDLESIEAQQNNLDMLNQSSDFTAQLAILEEQVARYKTQDNLDEENWGTAGRKQDRHPGAVGAGPAPAAVDGKSETDRRDSGGNEDPHHRQPA